MATASDVLPTRLPLMTEPPIAVNDVHGRISATHVRRVVSPRSVHDVAEAIDFAARYDLPVSVCGHRHAMAYREKLDQRAQRDVERYREIVGGNARCHENGHATTVAGRVWKSGGSGSRADGDDLRKDTLNGRPSSPILVA